MHTPVEITFRGMTSSPAIEAAIGRWAARLDHAFDEIRSCAVVVEQPHHWPGIGRTFVVKLDLAVSDRTIHAHSSGHEAVHDDIYVAVADAFRAAIRQLRDRAYHLGASAERV